MKNKIALVLTALIMFPTSMAFAEDANDPMGVKLISGPEEDAETVSLDDVKTGKEIEIEGFGDITFTSFIFEDMHDCHDANNWNTDLRSGQEADYACLYFDVINTTTKDKDYLANFEVTAVYDEDYKYAGWGFQIDNDWDSDYFINHESDRSFAISPMYSGHYVVGATLPNAVINGKKELKLLIKLDGNEMTYYIRKA